MVFFPNTTATIMRYVKPDDYDEYGEKTGEYQETTIIPIDLQPMSPTESIKEYGEVLQDTFKIYIDSTVDILPEDQLVIDTETYAIIGTPMKMTHLTKPSHIKVNIQKLREV